MEITYNSQYLMKDGSPWFPVMGEMHYSRYKEDFWEESLRKMKAGGVEIVSAYVIWLHHEEQKGIFDFSGCRNLKRYVELCAKVGIKVFLRLGPWVHGECRNGGFPDWVVDLKDEGVRLRSDNEVYLSYVRRYWTQVAKQVRGQMDRDGGPVIGVQLENEYGHVGGMRGEEGNAHMRTLMALAKELGFQVPMYTATGWGGAVIGDALPVMGGYCEAPWARSTGEIEANANYIISHVRNDALIACDHKVGDNTAFDEKKYPYLTAELGGGMQVTAHRRPVASGTDIGAMSHVKLASGVALLGYYMYHGGSNPKGRLSTLQESLSTKYINNNDLPEINYDFNAPVRQYGTISDTYREIKLLALFLRDFGEDLATLPAEIDPENVKPEDRHTLRKSCRHDGTHGYVFFSNYQRRRTMEIHENVVFRGLTDEGEVVFPPVDLADGAYGFFPYNMQLGDAVLEYALATPLCRLGGEHDTFVFYGDYREDSGAAYHWKGGMPADVLHLTREQALNAFKVSLDRDYLVINNNYVWVQEGGLVITGGIDSKILTYPELEKVPAGFVKTGMEGRLAVYERHADITPAGVEFVKLSQDGETAEKDGETAEYEIRVKYFDGQEQGVEKSSGKCPGDNAESRLGDGAESQPGVHAESCLDRSEGRDIFLWLSYSGYSMEIFADGEKINDHFYTGQQVPVSLGYFGFPEKLTVRIKALHQDDKVFLEKLPEFTDGRACSLDAVEVVEELRQRGPAEKVPWESREQRAEDRRRRAEDRKRRADDRKQRAKSRRR